jgi:muconolactone delta-isomerase
MLFLVELDHVKSGLPLSPEAGQSFIAQFILPTLARAEQLAAEKKVIAGGPVVGHIALRLIVEADSMAELDKLIYSLALYPLAETKITPLMTFAERRASVQTVIERLSNTSK